MKPALRFAWASLASALSAMVLLTLTMPLTLLATTGEATGEGFWPTLGSMVVMLPFVVVIGGMVALPTAALAGGAMLLWQKNRAAPLPPKAWIAVGLGAGLLVALFVGTNDPLDSRLVTALWFAGSGALGAWVFARVWAGAGLLKK